VHCGGSPLFPCLPSTDSLISHPYVVVAPHCPAPPVGDRPRRHPNPLRGPPREEAGDPTPIPDLSPCPIEKSPMNPQWALKTEPGAGVGLHFKEIFSKIFPAIKPSDLSSGNISTSALHGGFVCGFPPKFLVEYLLTKVSQFKFGLFFFSFPPWTQLPFPPFSSPHVLQSDRAAGSGIVPLLTVVPISWHHGATRVHFLSFGPVAVLHGVLHDKGMSCHRGWVGAHKFTATCWPRDQFVRRMSAGLVPARHSAPFTSGTLCCAQMAFVPL